MASSQVIYGANPDAAPEESLELLSVISNRKAKTFKEAEGIHLPKDSLPYTIHYSSTHTTEPCKEDNDTTRTLPSSPCSFSSPALRLSGSPGSWGMLERAAGFGFQLVNPDADFSMGHFQSPFLACNHSTAKAASWGNIRPRLRGGG